jgi:ferredoxin/flavodoxin---NADP+ reductase
MITEKVTWVHHWSDRTFSFKTTRSESFRFYAGEFAMIGLRVNNKNVLRAYSVVSPPWKEELEFLSIKIQDGELTSKLQHIQVGDEVILAEKTTGTLRNDALVKGGNLYMLATGTGLAPFMSLIRDIETLETWDKIHIIHSVRYSKDLAYTKDLANNFIELEPDLHEMIAGKLFYNPLITGLGDKRITTQMYENILNIDYNRDKIMLCGNLEFNKEVSDYCISKGMVEGSLREPGTFVIERAFVEK